MISVATVALFYALLALVANAIVIGLVVLRVAGPRAETARAWLDGVRGSIAPVALPAAFIVAVAATAGSLYFSEVAHFEPCRLCWYQRIAMYPLVVILGVAAWRRDGSVRRYAFPLAAIGAVIALYHYVLEWLPSLDLGACQLSTPCTLVYFRELGFISIPYLSLSAFLLILALLSLVPARETAGVDRAPAEPVPAA